MTLRLTLDLPRWRRHLDKVMTDPDVIPVLKGNGYGFGVTALARECSRLRAPAVAVGTPAEASVVRGLHPGTDVLVLNPLLPADVASLATRPGDERLVRIAARHDVLDQLATSAPGQRVVVEMASPMQRFGLPWKDLHDLRKRLGAVRCEGLALHLPTTGDRVGTVSRALQRIREGGARVPALWVSHLSPDELAFLRAEAGSTRILLRTGTELWLGDPQSYSVSGLVVDTHPIRRGDAVGYRQARAARSGTLVVVSGGTANGVGLRVTAQRRQRIVARARDLVSGLLEVKKLAPSPFSYQGSRLPYVDVPHMQVSMLLAQSTPPSVGERLPCAVRMTLAAFDEVELVDHGRRLETAWNQAECPWPEDRTEPQRPAA